MKKIISLILSACLIIALVPITAFADVELSGSDHKTTRLVADISTPSTPSETDPVASIGNNVYTSIAAAVDAIKGGASGDIVVLKDHEVDATISISGGTSASPIVLDLNGKTVKFIESKTVYLDVSSNSYFLIKDTKGGGSLTRVNNNHVPQYGGLIYASGANLTVSGVTFKNCASTALGGAIYAANTTLTINKSMFDGCSTGGPGGAIYSSGGSTMITDTAFKNCSASDLDAMGGAVYTSKNETTLDNCTFDGCTAPSGHGGAIYSSSKMTVKNCKISGCEAGTSTSSGLYGGGAFFVFEADVTITDTNITGCTALNGGGGYVLKSSFTMNGGQISGCSTTVEGGGVMVREASKLEICGSADITGNTNSSGKADDLYLSSGTKITQSGNFTGSVGITQQDGAQVETVFGEAGASGQQYTGSERFFYNGSNLIGCLYSNEDNCPIKWIENAFTVTLNKNGGSGGDSSITVSFNEDVPYPINLPEKECYEFAGYYDESGAEPVAYYDKDGENLLAWAKASGGELIAHWTPNHNTTLHPEVKPTCTATGNNAYYTCSACGGVFKDAQGTKATTEDAEKLSALGHDWSNKDGICKRDSSHICDHNGIRSGICPICGKNLGSGGSIDESHSDYGYYRQGTYDAGTSGAVTGIWLYDIPSGIWSFTLTGGTKITNGWVKAINPYSTGSQPKASWFYFDESGRMLTGWQWIKDSDGVIRCYYLNPLSNGLLGACWLDGRTPDGYTVDKNGAWTESGKVKTR